ncbi:MULTISPECIES: TetR/AcrR family transcriptional regulator [unclassified Burkholderia]|uniref:TetR/AcrR family transcriptional regulator n=1 Tax=unclassified Burkholderia TaxID=2613784 RepID=UPI000F58DFD8|nr:MULTISPECIES: TetR/AcrR family transcriptional regulator [unclassified Burkholderia]RQS26479.1 TetR/AcrR family transcriptional regulator [Burkholderia sp. Bp8995]RQS48457.1 TetR/AcrR family transcriptional regulator [Burkholderia sp. Bp8989]
MGHERLTREQSNEQTCERMLEAAHEIFLKKGYAAASIQEIAETAGYSRGAFYANFRDRSELLIELLRRDHDRRSRAYQSMTNANDVSKQLTAMVYAYHFNASQAKPMQPLWVEAKLLAIRDVDFRVHYNALLRAEWERLTSLLSRLANEAAISLSVPAEMIALGLISLCDGLYPYAMLNPTLTRSGIIESILRFAMESVAPGGT